MSARKRRCLLRSLSLRNTLGSHVDTSAECFFFLLALLSPVSGLYIPRIHAVCMTPSSANSATTEYAGYSSAQQGGHREQKKKVGTTRRISVCCQTENKAQRRSTTLYDPPLPLFPPAYTVLAADNRTRWSLFVSISPIHSATSTTTVGTTHM